MATYVAVFALVLAYLALVGAWFALRALRRIRRSLMVLTRGGTGDETVLVALQRHVEAMDVLSGKVDRLRTEVADARSEAAEASDFAERARASTAELAEDVDGMLADSARGLRNVALVRFNASEDMTGRQSFVLAMLDDEGDGIALTALASNTGTRLGAKGVADGVGQPGLSADEQRAVDAALSRRHARPVEIIPGRQAS